MRGGGGGGGGRNNVHSCMATLPKTSVFPAFLPRMFDVSGTRHAATSVHVLGEDAPSTGYLQHFFFLIQHIMEQRHAVTGVRVIGEDATTLVSAAFSPLCTHFCLFAQHQHKNAVRSVFARKQHSKLKHVLGRDSRVSKPSLCAVFSRAREHRSHGGSGDFEDRQNTPRECDAQKSSSFSRFPVSNAEMTRAKRGRKGGR